MATKKASTLSEEEHYFSGFLIDLDVQDTVSIFRKAHITACGDDRQTVHEAWQECRMVVTHNEKDFVRFIPEHSRRDSGRRCLDCWGLLLLPGDKITRKRAIAKITKGIVIEGKLSSSGNGQAAPSGTV